MPKRPKKSGKMFALRLMTAWIVGAIASCASTPKPKIVSFGNDIPRPHVTLVDSCQRSEVSPSCAEGIETAIRQSGELVERLATSENSLNECSAHIDIDTMFYDTQLAAMESELNSEKWKKWYWSGIVAAVSIVATFIYIKHIQEQK